MSYDNKSLQELIRAAQIQQKIINEYRIPDLYKILSSEPINSIFTKIQAIDNSILQKLIEAGTLSHKLAQNFEQPNWVKARCSLYGIDRSVFEQTHQLLEIIRQSTSSIGNIDLVELNQILNTPKPFGHEVFNLIQTCEEIGIDPKLYESIPISVFHSLLTGQNVCDYKDILTQFNSTADETRPDRTKHKSNISIKDLIDWFTLILIFIQIFEGAVDIYSKTHPQKEIDTEQLKAVLIQALEDAQNEINERQNQQSLQPQLDLCNSGRDQSQANQHESTHDKCQGQPTGPINDQLPQSNSSDQIIDDMDQRAKYENNTGEKQDPLGIGIAENK